MAGRPFRNGQRGLVSPLATFVAAGVVLLGPPNAPFSVATVRPLLTSTIATSTHGDYLRTYNPVARCISNRARDWFLALSLLGLRKSRVVSMSTRRSKVGAWHRYHLRVRCCPPELWKLEAAVCFVSESRLRTTAPAQTTAQRVSVCDQGQRQRLRCRSYRLALAPRSRVHCH